ncbi:MAG: cyanoexosortase B system-associated protein [Xenococcaceae cyanobacterium]
MSSLKSNWKIPMSLPKFKGGTSISRLALVLLLILLIGIGGVPGYWTGNLPWSDLPRVTNINQIRSLRQTGLTLPGWKTLDQKEVKIGGHKWSKQKIQKDAQKPVTLLLLPQNYYRDQPQVEWMDINGSQQWKTDSYSKLDFTFEEETASVEVKARFFRAWKQQTFAVVQWYAWPGGGHYAPAQWFWSDQLAQLRRRRVPWVAVCLKIPIEPLGDLEAAWPLAKSLAKTVQATLNKDPFSSVSMRTSDQ